jgi:aspartate kinase
VIESGSVPVLQGFIGSTRENATTTLGFEGSDYTAAIIGAAVEAGDIQIWKDVSGLMTCDPAVYQGARTVKVCTFAEAADLTYFGAKVLHPKAIHPAARLGIPVHIYNSKQPRATGTFISATAPASTNLIKSIAYKRPITVISVKGGTSADDARAGSPEDLLKGLLDALGRRRVRPLITAVSAASIALAVDSRELGDGRERDLLEEISSFATVRAEPGKAIVSLVGEELPSDPSLMGRVFKAIDETPTGLILHGSSPITVNMIVDELEVEGVIARLHEVFFAKLDPQVFE